MKVATDIGGTFTDLVYLDDRSLTVGVAKAASTPANYADGVVAALSTTDFDPASIEHFVHGTTVVINALTERNGARVALVTTQGFRDVLEIGRANRPDMYNLLFTRQPPFVSRERRFEVAGRVNYKGDELEPLDDEEVRALASRLRDAGVDAVAVSLLHSYVNPAHELRCAEILSEELPGVFVSASADLTREWREYERTSSVVLNSYVQPVAASYLRSLEERLREQRIRSSLYVMRSNGGIATFSAMESWPIHMIESGPVAGVLGAQMIGEAIGERNLLTIDIGGTTAKTSLIDRGELKVTTDYRIERDRSNPGYPMKVPVVDIVEIGAGGGSIAWIGREGSLRVGPQSAGAVPGPAAYGQGGEAATVTDANVVIGRINPDYFLGGEIALSVDRAREALQPIADHAGTSIEEAALGVIQIANANMVNALKLVSVRRGYDPRDFALMAFGGGGSMHAAEIARELQIRTVIIPPAPGVFSAWGMLVTDLKHDVVKTQLMRSEPGVEASLGAVFGELSEEAAAFFASCGLDRQRMVVSLYAEMRYLGQEHTVRVPILASDEPRSTIEERFHDAHERTYTFRLDSPIEFVTFHLTGVIPVEKPDLRAFRPEPDGRAAEKGERDILFAGRGWQRATIFERRRLAAGAVVGGPAIIEEPAATTVVHPGQRAVIDEIGNIIMTTEV